MKQNEKDFLHSSGHRRPDGYQPLCQTGQSDRSVIAVEEVVPEGAEAAEAVSEEVAVDENGNPIAEEETVSEAEAVSVEEAADPAEEETPADAVPAE